MRQLLFIMILFFLMVNASFSQKFTDSNLPVIIINTDGGVDIPDNPRVMADMKIIYRGPHQRNYLTDQNNVQYLNYDGRIDIEIRGSSSLGRDKKQYGFSTLLSDNVSNNNVSLLDLPKENDWILNGMVWDPAMIRDYLSYNLSRQLGHYASRTVYCEVVINGSYKGLYLLEEKIKADDNRVDISEMTTSDNSIPEITGGYITKADKVENDDVAAWTEYDRNGELIQYLHVYPKPEKITSGQNEYIQSQFEKLSTAATNNDASPVSGFPSVIDIPSFIDYMIINELSSNYDAYTFSTFFNKERNGKLRAGPVWDTDQAFGNDIWGSDKVVTDAWMFSNGIHDGSAFWQDLFNNDQFRCCFSKRWNEITQPDQPFYLPAIENFIDKTVEEISEAVSRENNTWGTIGDFEQNIMSIKSFLSARMTWITANIGSFSECENLSTPPLIITKIMYHPAETSKSPDGKDPEFIEITNNGDKAVDMTGMYFSGTGLGYQFPVNTNLEAHASLIISSNSEVFFSIYNTIPLGQFTRHLSNKSQNLVLSDAFGNVIDNVQYSDSLPWPDADGNGFYLKLKDMDLDNNIGTNWLADDYLLGSECPASGYTLNLFPNPATDIITISSGSEMLSYSIFDLQGRRLKSEVVHNISCYLDMRPFAKGLYFIKIVTSDRVFTKKIIKK